MPSTHIEFKTEESAYDTSFHLEAAFKRESPLGFMADCPSLSSSFLSSGSSIAGSHYLRRSSLGSCSSVTSPDMFFTPPATIADADGDTIINAKVGLRFGFGELGSQGFLSQSDFAISYGRAITNDELYENIIRVEMRVRY